MGGYLNPLLLRIIYFVKVFLNIIRFIIPIILIVKVILEIYKYIIKTKEKLEIKPILYKVLATVLIFFTPTIVKVILNLSNNLFESGYSGLSQCLEFANLDYINELQKERDQKEMELFLTEQEKNLNNYEKKVAEVRAIVKSEKINAKVGKPASKSNVIKCGTGSKYNTELFNTIRSAGYKSREGVTAAAIYLSSHINVHIPYFWSGGHYHTYDGYNDSGKNMIGVSDKWGCSVKMQFGGTAKQKNGTPYPFGLDCSGFVAWAILNGGYYVDDSKQKIIISTHGIDKSIGDVSVTSVSWANGAGKAKPGDIAYKSGHVGMIVEVKDKKYVVAEEKNYANGLVLTEYDKSKSRFTHIILMDNFYNNYKKDTPLWSGFK